MPSHVSGVKDGCALRRSHVDGFLGNSGSSSRDDAYMQWHVSCMLHPGRAASRRTSGRRRKRQRGFSTETHVSVRSWAESVAKDAPVSAFAEEGEVAPMVNDAVAEVLGQKSAKVCLGHVVYGKKARARIGGCSRSRSAMLWTWEA